MIDSNPQHLNPLTPESLPEMSRREATFHASVAGVRAATEAGKQGSDPAHIEALGTAAIGGREIHGITLPLPCAYSALSVPALSALLERHSQVITGLQSDCLFIAAFAYPQQVYGLTCVQRDATAVEALLSLANQIAITLLHREHIDTASAWCLEAFARLNGVKKPSSPEATSPPPSHPYPQTPASESASETKSSVDSPPALPTAVGPVGSPAS